MSKALLVIDCQNGFMPNGESPVNDMPKIIPNIVKLIKKWNDKIILTKYIYKRSPNPLIDIAPELCPEGSLSAELVTDLLPFVNSENVSVLKKYTYSAFAGTKLEEILRGWNINEIYIVGVTTDCCVLATVFSAYDKRIAVRVIKECVAATEREINDNILESIKSCIEEDAVISINDLL